MLPSSGARAHTSWFQRLSKLGSLVLLGSLIIFLAPFSGARADSAPFPIFPDNVLSTFNYKVMNVVQPNSPNLQIVPVTGQSFTSALQATTPANAQIPPDDSGPYSITTQAPISQAVAKNDVIDLTFWLQQVSAPAGQSQTTVNFERIGGDYAKSLNRNIFPSSTWTQYHYIFRAVDDFPAGGAQLSFWLGYNPGQVIAIGGIVANDLGPNAYVPPPSYDGRDPNAPWRAAAAQRIEKYRKGNLNVTVFDQSGNPIPNANVHVQMLNHDFNFGTAVDAYRVTDNSNNADSAKYRAELVQLFNHAVLDNANKWDEWENADTRINHAIPAIQWLRDNGLTVRGHNLLWNTPWYPPQPDVPALLQDPKALSNRLDNHILNEVSTLRGQITDWDVINELYGGHSWADLLGGDAALAHWFQVAHQADPHAQLAFNDDPFFLSDGSPNTGRIKYYSDIISYMKQHNAPIDRLGVESHFSPDALPSLDNVVKTLDQIAALGVKPQVTEFDLSTTDNQLQADYTRDYLTAVFSDPNVDTFMIWGFWNGDVWLPNTGLFNNDWSLKPNGQQWMDLIYHQWWTDVTGTTDNQGAYKTRGFTGDYQVDVTVNGKTNTVYTKLSRDGKNLKVTFDPNAPQPPAPPAKPLPPPTPGAAPFVPDRGAQLISNGSFDAGTNSWYCFGGCPLTQEQTTVHSASNALLVSGRQAFWQGPAQNITSGVHNGTTYQSSVWARVAAGAAPETLNVAIKIVTDATDSNGLYFPVGTAQVTADGWTQLTGSATLSWTGNIKSAEWWVSSPYGSPNSDFYIDDASITSPVATPTVQVQNLTSFNGDIEGSLQQLTASTISFGSSAKITRGLYVPGEPLMQQNGTVVVPVELPSSGNIEPSDKTITLTTGDSIPSLISRTDATAPAPVAAPATPTGTVDVTIDHAGQTVADFNTLRDLKLNSNVGEVVVPAGTYGNITVGANDTLTLGVAGATSPTVYNLQGLTLKDHSLLKVVGPVAINLAHGPTINGTAGSAQNPFWLTLNVAQDDVIVNGHATINGVVNAPSSGVTVNWSATIYGRVIADHLNVDSGGTIKDGSLQ